VPTVRNPEWECANGHHPGDRRLRVGRNGVPICPICTAKPAGYAFLYAFAYAVGAVVCGVGASKTSGIVSALLVVVAMLLGAVAIWTAAFMGGVFLLVEWAKHKSGDRDG
jgi:hypothetical protein